MGGAMQNAALKPGDWRIDVGFADKGALKASASGVLLVAPEDAVVFVTDKGAIPQTV